MTSTEYRIRALEELVAQQANLISALRSDLQLVTGHVAGVTNYTQAGLASLYRVRAEKPEYHNLPYTPR